MMNDKFVSMKLCQIEISRNSCVGTEKNEEMLQSRFTICRPRFQKVPMYITQSD